MYNDYNIKARVYALGLRLSDVLKQIRDENPSLRISSSEFSKAISGQVVNDNRRRIVDAANAFISRLEREKYGL